MTDQCPWWAGWLHRRLRQSDRETLIPKVLLGAAKARHVSNRAAFALFLTLPGQEHWLCPCAEAERRELEATLGAA